MMKAIALAAALATAAAQVTIEVEISAGSGWVVNPGDAGYPDIAANVRPCRPPCLAVGLVSG